MKKIISVILCAAVLIGAMSLVSCSKEDEKQGETSENIKIVATIFPIYDWVKNITGDSEGADITMLINSGADLHSFQPSADDIIKISSADLFIYVGGESDEWANDVVKKSGVKAINLLETLGSAAKEEELKEGMQGEEEEEAEEGEEPEYDEHIWLSVKNAKALVGEITNALCEIDSANAETYKSNSADYKAKLDALDKEYEEAVSTAANKTLLFGDRFPFRYLTEDYSLDYYAAFIGCSAETEASFETVTFLANKVDELSLKYVIALEGTDHKLAQTIIDNTKSKSAEILTLNSMQSITSNDVASGISYIDIMQNNLAVLKTALN